MNQKHTRDWFVWLAIPLAGFAAGILVGADFSEAPAVTPRLALQQEEMQAVSDECRTMVRGFSQMFEAAAARVSPGVVPIFAEQTYTIRTSDSADNFLHDLFGNDELLRRFFGMPGGVQKQTVRSLGSGVVIDPAGYILTNDHVVRRARKLTVVLNDDSRHVAKVIGTDPQTDVAVIKIDADDLPAVILGNSDDLRVGQWVIAVGNPFQLLHSVTQGIISARGRSDVGLADYEDFIQTDASINPGNSGGALADLDGRVIGINTAISTSTGASVGIGFAIPINLAREVMEQLIQKGKVTRGFLGVVPQDLDESLAKALGLDLKETPGALIGDVGKNSPAEKAGIRRGDVITEFEGQAIKSSSHLRNLIAQTAPGTKVRITILRDGRERTVTPVLEEQVRADNPAEEFEEPFEEPPSKGGIGLSVLPLTPELAEKLGYENDRGVVVMEVTSGSASSEAGLLPGDLIQEVDRREVPDAETFQKTLERLRNGEPAALLVKRGDNTFFVAIDVP